MKSNLRVNATDLPTSGYFSNRKLLRADTSNIIILDISPSHFFCLYSRWLETSKVPSGQQSIPLDSWERTERRIECVKNQDHRDPPSGQSFTISRTARKSRPSTRGKNSTRKYENICRRVTVIYFSVMLHFWTIFSVTSRI